MTSSLMKLLSSCKFRSLEGKRERMSNPFFMGISYCVLDEALEKKTQASKEPALFGTYLLNPNSVPGQGIHW